MADPFPSPNPNPTPDAQQQPPIPPMNYRKGNWTVEETLTLINAKRLQDNRRHAAASSPLPYLCSAQQSWKWIENYCCAHGYLRSQNQCIDKWDNLLREYKMVRNYESRNVGTKPDIGANQKSYWEMEPRERKEFNLPTNMAFDVHESLTVTLNLRNARRISVSPTPSMMIPPRPQPKDLSPLSTVTQAATQTEDSAELDESVEEEREMKRSKVLSQTLMTSEENRQRHKELMELEERKLRLEERRLRLEEERSKMKKQAVSGLLSAINGLSNAVHVDVSEEQRTVDDGRT